jgi:glycosyltransferase involved in cell wall biosynthesis
MLKVIALTDQAYASQADETSSIGENDEEISRDTKAVRVAAFTAGIHIPGARFRVRQYISPLQRYGIEIREFFPGLSAYPPRGRALRPLWAAGSLGSRAATIAKSYGCDVTLLQREMLSTFVTLEPFTRKPRVLDVDDAIWLHRDGSFAQRLARLSNSVICGNSFLADQFRQWNKNIAVIPTAVDTSRFIPATSRIADGRPTIGWSGGSGGFVDLKVAERALQIVLEKHPQARLRIISDSSPSCLDLPASQVEFVAWSQDTEVQAIQDIDIGIMPLVDNTWNRGKCSYKMLLYMSCGVPVVVSPIGMNVEICRKSRIGIEATTTAQWVDAIDHLLGNPQLAAVLGSNARELVVQNYSIDVIAPKLATELHRVATSDAG